MPMPPAHLLSAFAVMSFSLAELRSQMTMIVVGLILLVVGIGAVTLFFFRRKSRDLTLIYFSLFATLYAVRLLLHMSVIYSLAGVSDSFRGHIFLWITSVLLIPFLLFLRQVQGPQIKTLVKVGVIAQAIFAAVAITADLFGVGEKLAYAFNNCLVLAVVGGLMANFLFFRFRGGGKAWTRELRVLTTGLLVFGAFVLHGNLVSLGLLPGPDAEALGFLFFVGCLGYISVRRTFANEERLLAIGKELEIAGQIQSSILPREVPRIAGFDIAARYLPMSAVAGDFYDFLVVDETHIGILIADVTGHGVPAALIASMLKVAFVAQSPHADDPARVLTGLNRALCGKFEDHFVTGAYVFVDTEKSVMRYAGAGHPPLMLASRSPAGVRVIEENGVMLGLFPDAAYSATEIPLRPGDRCLLYTDGVVEAMNATREEFGKARLEQFLAKHPDLPADRFATALLDEISRWTGPSSGRRQEDDITLVVLDIQHSLRARE
jgi:sigma-B regulation protein RsbU (phosphoserine phosphatase)